MTLGFGVLGWLSGSGNVSFRLRRAQRDAQKGVEDMNYKTVLKRAQRESVILFDTEEGNERAWMVPQLSLILDLLNYWAFTENLADIRYAAPHPDGAAKALEILEDPVYANRVLEAKIAEDEKDFTVSRMVTQICGKILQRMTKDSERDEGARGMITLGRTGISGWDWLELNNKLAWSVPRRRTVQREHKLLQPDLNPSWMPLAQVIPIFMGQCEGELMAPIRASEEVCRRWYPMPGGLDNCFLVANVRCMSNLADYLGTGNDRDVCWSLPISIDKHVVWHFTDRSLFQPCRACMAAGNNPPACPKQPQSLVDLRNKLRRPRASGEQTLVSAPLNGAIVFGLR